MVNPYGENGLVYIADTPEEFIKGIEQALDMRKRQAWLKAVDTFLSKISHGIITVEKMMYHINTKLESKQHNNLIQKENEYV